MADKEGFFFICTIGELEDNKGKRFYVKNTDIAVIKYEGNI